MVLNDEINGARDVTKTNTYRVETFRAGELGLLGYVDADKVALLPRLAQAPHRALGVRRPGTRERCRKWTSSIRTCSRAR